MGEQYDLPELRQMLAGRDNRYTGVTLVGKTHLGRSRNLTSSTGGGGGGHHDEDYIDQNQMGRMSRSNGMVVVMLPSSSSSSAAAAQIQAHQVHQGQPVQHDQHDDDELVQIEQKRVQVVDRQFRSDSSSHDHANGFVDNQEGVLLGGNGNGNGRWPRQETLTLLEVRSLLDHKFKESNHKGPLWDEVSRIMAAEHGYQRSGKKCREKLENLYKYYKKTKEGKAGRQDGKHYRFFRQLEALYGENSNAGAIETNPVENKPFLQIANPSTSQANQETLHVQKISESLGLSNSSDSNASSSSDDEDLSAIAFTETDTFNKRKDTGKLKRGRKGWKAKIREFVDLQMKRFMDIQEAWLERMLKTLEHHEQERLAREEAWRKQESERFNHEHRIWANERAWIEARSTALIEALNKFNRPEMKASLSPQELTPVHIHEDGQDEMENGRETFGSSLGNKRCSELEILYLIQIRAAMETEFKETGCFNLALWQEVAGKMGCLGYDIDAKQCKEKWENINGHLKIKNKDCNKKRKENSKTCPYFHHLDSPYNMQEGGGISSQGTNEHVLETAADRPEHQGPSPSNSNAGAIGNYSCLRFLMADGDQNLWENYAVKLNKEESQ